LVRPAHRDSGWATDREAKGQTIRIVRDTEYRPRRLVEARDDPVQVDEWRLAKHGGPETDVVAMIRVGAPVAIAEASLREAVVVGAVTPLDRRSSRNGQRHFRKYRGFEYALRAYERHPSTVEVEASVQDRAGRSIGCSSRDCRSSWFPRAM